MEPTWDPSGADRTQVGPMNFVIWEAIICANDGLVDGAYMRQLGSMSLTVIIPLFHTMLSWQIHRYSAA